MAFTTDPSDDDFGTTEDENNESAPPEESNNRTFIIIAAVMGSIMLLILICIAVYGFVYLPQTRNAERTQAALGQVDQTAVAISATQSFESTAVAQGTPSAFIQAGAATSAAKTSVALGTPASGGTGGTGAATSTTAASGGGPGSASPTPTATSVVVRPSATATATVLGAGGPNSVTQTVSALQTQVAGAQKTIIPTSTLLPNTGFADDIGLPALFGMAVMLIVVIFLARRLRHA